MWVKKVWVHDIRISADVMSIGQSVEAPKTLELTEMPKKGSRTRRIGGVGGVFPFLVWGSSPRSQYHNSGLGLSVTLLNLHDDDYDDRYYI